MKKERKRKRKVHRERKKERREREREKSGKEEGKKRGEKKKRGCPITLSDGTQTGNTLAASISACARVNIQFNARN